MFRLGDTALSKLKGIRLMYSLNCEVFDHQKGHLLVGKFTFTGGESRGAGGENPHQFIS